MAVLNAKGAVQKSPAKEDTVSRRRETVSFAMQNVKKVAGNEKMRNKTKPAAKACAKLWKTFKFFFGLSRLSHFPTFVMKFVEVETTGNERKLQNYRL